MNRNFEDQEELERMRTEIETVETKEIALPEKVSLQFGKAEIFAKIEEFRPFVGMTIAGVADKATYAKVKAASTALMRLRTGAEARKKSLKAEAMAYNRTVDEAYNEITGAIVSIESQLDKEIKRIDDIAKAEAEAKQKAINERVAKRTQELTQYRHDLTGIAHLLAGMPDDQYEAIREGARAKWQAEEDKKAADAAELARLQAEEAARKAEEERKRREALEAEEAKLKAMREEQERIAKAQREQQEAIDKENARLAAVKAEEERKVREAKIAAEAAEKARIETEAKAKAEAERIIREAQEKADREKREAEEKRKADEAKAKAELARLAAIEAAKPDAEKLAKFASLVRAIELPDLTTAKGQDVLRLLAINVENLAKLVESEAATLTK